MDNLIGLTAGDFRIIKLIGRGGMSSVYLAIDSELERNVALKIPHDRFIDNPGFVKRFRREAKAMARLRHPNIVQIYSVGSHGELPFFAMEYVGGACLDKTIRNKGPFTLGVALDYISQIAHAIEYAHRKGVIHRDIKPANILIDPSGRLLVTDFGVSKMMSEEITQDTVGFVGTPQYMSPEQCGQGDLDHRTDIYSMGAVLFEMLTGKPAFSSDSPAAIIKKQLFDMPEFPSGFEEKTPKRVMAIISKMLAKDPGERYPDIRSFLHELEKAQRECEDSAIASSTAKTVSLKMPVKKRAAAAKPRRKGKRRAALALACLLVVCVASLAIAFKRGAGEGVDLDAIKKLIPKATVSAASLPQEAPPATPEPHKTMGHAAAVVEPQWASAVIDSMPPGAEVFLDSQPHGTTPLTLSKVAPGRHMLAMRLKGYPSHSEEVLIEAERPINVFHDFEAAQGAIIPRGSLVIDSEPPGAAVYVNGEKKGVTRLEMPGLRSAEYTIELRLEDYESLQKRITLLPDENLRISLNLVEKPKFGGLGINSHPRGAEVLLNGTKRGQTPLVLSRLQVGEYEIMLRKKGYKPYKQIVVCEEDSTGIIEASLEMTPKFAAMQSAIVGDRHAKLGDLASAAEAYNRALSLDPQSPAYGEKLKRVKRFLLKREIQDLLSSYEFAYDNENAELLASLIDEGNPEFLSDQMTNAESLFREFDNIDMALSEPKLGIKGPQEVFVEFQLSIDADFAETGLSANLLKANRTLTLRRSPETGWKICAIE